MSEPKITPLARRLAEENGIDWRKLEGTGPEGEITERDILDFLAKVMAGEITLEGPPPGEPPPPEGEADLEAARAALEKEGITLEELLPAEEPGGKAQELTSEFELELDLLEEETEAPPAEAKAPGPELEPEPSWSAETTAEDVTSEPPIHEEPEAPPIEAPEPAPPPEDVTAELPVFTEEAPVEEPPPEITAELPVYQEEKAPEPPAEEITAELPVYTEETPPAPEPEPEPEPVAAAAVPPPPASEERESIAVEEPAAPVAPEVRLWFRPVALGPLDALLSDFGAELGRELPRATLLFLAARRALADLEVPLRPLKGRYRVPQSESFAGFVAAWEAASEEGKGLSVDEAEPPVLLKAPALVLATGGLPEGQGLLILAGELPTAEEKFLERVAHYLEKPIRLLLFG